MPWPTGTTANPGDLQLHIYQDRVEIINPGGLVGGLKIEELGKKSIPRNPQLFGLMQRMDMVERVGEHHIRATPQGWLVLDAVIADLAA